MVTPLYRTRAITSTRLSASPRNKVSALLMRKYCNKADPGPSRQLYHSHGRSFPPLICAFGLVSGGVIVRQLQKLHGTSQSDSFYKPSATTEEQEFWNSIMSYLKRVVHLTHVMVHRFYHARAIRFTRPSRFLAICAFGLISRTIFRQLRNIHSTVNLEKSHTTEITAVEPKFPIFCELRLSVEHNPTGFLSVDVYVHGLWMCYYDSNGDLIHLVNEMPTEADAYRAYEDLAELDDASLFELKFKWPNFFGKDEEFWVKEFVKHALTSIWEYRPHYFRDVLSMCEPFIGGQKDIAKFLHNNYLPGVHYSATKIQGELSKHVGAKVQIVGSNKRPWHLQEIGILFTRDGKILVDHPKGSLAKQDIIVRLYEGRAV